MTVRFSLAALALATLTLSTAAQADDWSAPLLVDDQHPEAVYTPLPAGSATKPWHLCVGFPHMKDAYYVAKDYGVVTEAQRQGVGVTVMSAGGYDNVTQQIQQIEDCVAQGGDAVLVNAVSKTGLNGLIEELHGKGIPVLDMGNGMTSELVAAYSLAQYYWAGHTAGTYLADKHPAGSGKVQLVWLAGPTGSQWVEDAVKGMQDAIAGSDVELLKVMYGDTGKSVQMNLMEDALQTYPDVDIIGGVAPAIEGAMEIVQAKELNDIQLISFYSTPAIEQAVREGRVMATVNDYNAIGSRISVDQAVRLLEGKLEIKVAARRFEIIDASTVDSYDRTTLLAPDGFEPVFDVSPAN